MNNADLILSLREWASARSDTEAWYLAQAADALEAAGKAALRRETRALMQAQDWRARAETAERERDEAKQIIAEKAREWAAHYSEGSDGRNTFVLFAEWIEDQGRDGGKP